MSYARISSLDPEDDTPATLADLAARPHRRAEGSPLLGALAIAVILAFAGATVIAAVALVHA